MKINKIFIPALLGGIGGALNAFLCYAKIPVKVDNDFEWHIILAGGCHGALLVLIPVSLAIFCSSRKAWVRWAVLPVSGNLTGWLSFIPLCYSLNYVYGNRPSLLPSLVEAGVIENIKLKNFWWPFAESESVIDALWLPFVYFGFVGLYYVFGLAVLQLLDSRSLRRHLLFAVVSGILGSLWWWLLFKPWYLSLLHGMIWGVLTGFGMWRAALSPGRESPL